MISTRRAWGFVCGAAMLAVVVAGCSSGDSDDTASTAAPSSAPASATVTTTDSTSTASGGSTQEAIEAAQWSEGVDVSFDGGMVTLASDGIPNHARQDQYLVPVEGVSVPTDASEAEIVDDPTAAQDYSFEITTAPVYSDQSTPTELGPIGLVISGAALFNPYEADDSTTALDGNFDINGVLFVDSCSGHPTPRGVYHYHGVPYCITDVLDEAGQHSFMIGVLFDGFGVYGPRGEDGEAPTGLDECNGHVGPTPDSSADVYHYHLTETAPYSIRCYRGEVDASRYAPPGPPPDG